MGALQVLVFVASAVLVLENGLWMVEGAPSATYSYTTHHKASSRANAVASPTASNPSQQAAVSHHRGELSVTDYRKYLPVENTPEVKKAREEFFTLYKKQAKLAADAKDFDLDGTHTQTLGGTRTSNDLATGDEEYDYYYYGEDDESEYDDDEEEDEEEEEDEDEEESEEEDDDEDDDDDEDEEDSDEEDEEDSDEDEEDSSSSSSSEEDYGDSSSSEEDGEDSSSSEEDGEDSSSSSSSSEEDDGEAGRLNTYALTSRGRYQPLSTNLLQAPKPVTDTPEVKQAKRKFFELYKTQAELSFNAPDHK